MLVSTILTHLLLSLLLRRCFYISMQREGDLLLVPKHWSHATLNVESGISLAIFILDKYDSSTSEAYVRSELKVTSNTSQVHSDVTRSALHFGGVGERWHFALLNQSVKVCCHADNP